MANLTRILNNQITNSTIVASQKIAAGTITGSLFASNVTVPGDFLIAGNLFVLGSSSYTTIASTNTYVNDPLVVLNNGFAGTNTYDEGLIFNRGSGTNQAFIWSEVFGEFRLVATSEIGTTYGNINSSGLVRLSVGSLNVPGQANIGTLAITNVISASSLNVTGNVLAAGGIFNDLTVNGNETVTGYLNVTGNVMAKEITGNSLNVTGNVSTALLNAGQINTTGNVLAAAGVFSGLTVNGNESVTGYLNVTGNVMAKEITGNSLNVTGNVLAQVGTFNAVTVNGNETVTGYLNVTGNVLAAGGVYNYLDVNGNVDLGLAGQVSGSWINVIGNITQSTSGGAVYFNTAGNVMAAVGQFGAINSTGYINTSGNISTAQLNAGQINTTGNGLAAGGVYNALTVNGNESVTGYLNVTGNVLTAQLDAGQINTTGNVLAAGAVVNALTVNGNESVTGYLNVTGNVLASAIIGASLNVSGNVLAAGGVYNSLTVNGNESVTGYLNVTGNVMAKEITGNSLNVTGNVSTVLLNAGQINTTGNVLAAGAVVNALTVNGNESVTGYLNVTGNVLASAITGASLNVSGNVLGAAATFSSTQINGNETVTGYLNVAGNVLGSAGTLSTLVLNSTTNATESSGSSGALQIKGGASFAKDVWIGGNLFVSNIIGVTANVITVEDPLVFFKPGYTFPYNYDIGFYSAFTGPGLSTLANVTQHTAVIRNNSDNTWTFASNLAEPGAGHVVFGVDTVYDPIKAGNLTLVNTTASTTTGTGALIVGGGAGIAGAVTAGSFNTAGNILATGGIFNALTVNGSETVTGLITTAGINSSANILATGAVLNALTVNGTGAFTTLTATGNIIGGLGQFAAINSTPIGNASASTGAFTTLTATSLATTGNIIGGLGQFAAINSTPIGNATPSTGVFTTATAGAVSSGFIGNTGTAFTGASLNVSGNVLASGGVFNTASVNGNLTLGAALIAGGTGGTSGQYLQSTGTGLSWVSPAATNQISADGSNVTVTQNYVNVAINSSNVAAFTAAGLNNTNIGATAPGSGVFTNVITGNVLSGFIGNTGTVFTGSSLNVSGNVLTASLSAGQINTTGNLVATEVSTGTLNATGLINTTGNLVASQVSTGTLNATGFINTAGNVSAATVIAGQFNTTGNLVASQVSTGTLNATGFINTAGNISASRINADTLAATGTIWANATTDTSSLSTGALIVAGGAAVGKTLWVGEGAVINSTRAAEAFQVYGATGNNGLIYTNTAKNAIVFSSTGNVLVQDGVIAKFDSDGAIMLPVGATSGRPGSAGNVDVAGMIRFNTTINNMEFYDGTDWQTAGSSFTIISDRQFSGNVAGGFGNVDGTNTNFTLQASSTTAATIVSINGVMQFPTLAYSVTGTTMTFTEPPAPGDVIDARILTTTTTVSSITSGNGLNQFTVDGNYANIQTGLSVSTPRITVNNDGNIIIPNGSPIVYNQSNIAAQGTNIKLLDSFPTSAYGTAKYLFQIRDGANIESGEVLLAQDGVNVEITTYAVLAPGGVLGTFQSNISSGTVRWFYVPGISTYANIKIQTTYIV